MRVRAGTAAVAALLLAAGCSGGTAPVARETASTPGAVPRGTADTPQEPTRRLQGAPLSGATGLRLLVAADPPVIVDVDRGDLRPLPGAPRGGTVSVQGVDGGVLLQAGCPGCAAPGLFVMDSGSGRVRRIGAGVHAVPALDGRSVWVNDHQGSRCTLARLGLDGSTRAEARPVPCDRVLVADTALGLHWGALEEEGSEVIEPAGGRGEVFRAHRILAVVGDRVLSDDRTTLTLTDTGTGERTSVPRPTSIGGPSHGLVAPDGRSVAVSFDHPAWPGPRQRMDVWVLDLAAKRWRRMPSMPVHASLKRSGMAWTTDGRLVLAGRFDEVGDAVALWRPGDARLSLRGLRFPDTGADDFTVLAAG